MSMSYELPEIVKRAMVHTVTDIGQLSKPELYQLNKYVKKGWLSKGKGGPFPMIKTVYAHRGYDFDLWRQRYVDHIIRLSELDREAAAQRKLRGGI